MQQNNEDDTLFLKARNVLIISSVSISTILIVIFMVIPPFWELYILNFLIFLLGVVVCFRAWIRRQLIVSNNPKTKWHKISDLLTGIIIVCFAIINFIFNKEYRGDSKLPLDGLLLFCVLFMNPFMMIFIGHIFMRYLFKYFNIKSNK